MLSLVRDIKAIFKKKPKPQIDIPYLTDSELEIEDHIPEDL